MKCWLTVVAPWLTIALVGACAPHSELQGPVVTESGPPSGRAVDPIDNIPPRSVAPGAQLPVPRIPTYSEIRVRLFPLIKVPSSDPYPVTVDFNHAHFRNAHGMDLAWIDPVTKRQSQALVREIRATFSNLAKTVDLSVDLSLDGTSRTVSNPLNGQFWISPHDPQFTTQVVWDENLPTQVSRDYRGDFVIMQTTVQKSATGAKNCRLEVGDVDSELAWSVINWLDIEDYMVSVVPSEVFSTWPLAALEAQSLAARSYAFRNMQIARMPNSYSETDLDPTTCFQSYAGAMSEEPATREAVSRTVAEVITYQRTVIEALFSAHSGGIVASAADVFNEQLPYLPAHPDVADVLNPAVMGSQGMAAATWTRTVPASKLQNLLWSFRIHLDPNSILDVANRNASHRVMALKAKPQGGAWSILGANALEQDEVRNAFRREFGVRTSLFDIAPPSAGLISVMGYGLGHGVGMSQWGAYALALQGKSVSEIIGFYYPGTQIAVVPAVLGTYWHAHKR